MVVPYHEDVVCLGDLSSDAEELHQIVELSVNVSADCDRGAHRLDVGFFHQQLLDLSSSFWIDKDNKVGG